MSIEIIIPDIGEGAFPVVEFFVKPGDAVNAEDPLMMIESDKAAVEVPAPVAGVIKDFTISEGDTVSTGTLVGYIEASDASENALSQPEKVEKTETVKETDTKAVEETKTTEAPKPANTTVASIDEKAFGDAHASPSVRKLARELGVDLGSVRGTGRKGRVTADDVKGFVKTAIQSGGGAVGSGIPSIPAQDFSKFGAIETHKLSRINELTGEHMTRCWLNVPHVTQHDKADITDLEAFRKSLKPEAEKLGVRVTLLSFLMKVVVSGMKAYPKFNSSLSADGKALIMKQYFNIGIAVDTPNGLVVPVFKDVDQKSIYDISRELMEVSKKARDGKLMPNDLQGGCITISSLGGIGGTNFTPIVNAPEVAILGVSRSSMEPVWNGNEFVPRNMLPMSLSYDHRVIDGADGARFTRHVATMLEDFRRVML